jgi:hypothetical protein
MNEISKSIPSSYNTSSRINISSDQKKNIPLRSKSSQSSLSKSYSKYPVLSELLKIHIDKISGIENKKTHLNLIPNKNKNVITKPKKKKSFLKYFFLLLYNK